MSCGEPDAQEWASPVRRAGRGNGPAVTPAPRPGPTLRLGLPVATPLSVSGGEPPELDQARLVRMQLQAKLREPVAQISQEPLGVVSVLKARQKVVGVPAEDHVPPRVPAPLVGPQVKHVMQEHV